MNLKGILKALKLNESTISMVMGAIVVVIVGSLVIKYLKSNKGRTTLMTMLKDYFKLREN